MTKREALRQADQLRALQELGFTSAEAESLRRISVRLHSWYEKQCGNGNGCIERDDTTNKPYWLNATTGRRWPIRDLETGATRRLAGIVDRCNAARRTALNDAGELAPREPLAYYLQTDPRGAALYILRPGDVPTGEWPEGYYSRGICIY